jgi:hypothetical protein
MSQFNQMKNTLGNGNCAESRASKNRIAQLIFVPLIQSTIRFAWILNATNADEASEVDAISFAASVLPIIANCSPTNAEIIYNQIQGASPDFASVKTAFEETYECLGITCADVGGYWDVGNQNYHPGAEPCSGTCSILGGLRLVAAVVTAALLYFI